MPKRTAGEPLFVAEYQEHQNVEAEGCEGEIMMLYS